MTSSTRRVRAARETPGEWKYVDALVALQLLAEANPTSALVLERP